METRTYEIWQPSITEAVCKRPIAWVERPTTNIRYKDEFLKDEFIKSLIKLGFIPMSIADENGKTIYKIQEFVPETYESAIEKWCPWAVSL